MLRAQSSQTPANELPRPRATARRAWPWLARTAAMGALVACSSTPPPPFVLEVPDLTEDVSYDPAGGVAAPALMSGVETPAPRDDGADNAADDAADRSPEDAPETAPGAVRCRIVYLADPPAVTADFRSLTGRAVAVADLTGAAPVVPTPELTAGALYAAGPAAATWAEAALAAPHLAVVADRSVALPAGASLRLGVTARDLVEDPRDWLDEFDDRGPVPRRVGVDINATAMGLALALEMTDLDPENERALRDAFVQDPNLPAGPPPPVHTLPLRREAVAVDASPAPGAPVVVLLDSPFEGGNGTAMAVLVEAIDSEDATTGRAEAEAALALAGVERLLSSTPLTEESREALKRAEALRAFQERGGRAALLLLSEEADATLAADLALVATDEDLANLSAAAFGDTAPEDVDPATLGWALDAAGWTLLGRGALEETLPLELQGVLFRRAGAVARFPDIVLDLVGTSGGSLEAFEASLAAENRIALEDASPAGRVAAHDWLVERGLEIPDYDPLADRKSRRAALEAAEVQR